MIRRAHLRLLLVLLLLGPGAHACASEREPAPPATTPDSASHAPVTAPRDSGGVDDDVPAASDSGTARWTVDVTKEERQVSGVAIMRAVRTARHDEYDRIVFDFGSDALPSYTVEYVDRPVRACGSGDVVPLQGDAWLRVEFNPAYAHTEEGQPTISIRSLAPNLPNLKELKLTCDFEAYVEWVGGLAAPNPYRVIQLGNPTRLVVDVRSVRR